MKVSEANVGKKNLQPEGARAGYNYRKKWWLYSLSALLFGLLVLFYFCLPTPLFNTPNSTVLEDHKGELLAARIADDGQWRFPLCDSVPYKFEQAVLSFEDEDFYNHPGLDFKAIAAAVYKNLKAGKVVRGGSTISMQVMRLAGNNPERSLLIKIKETLQALRLEVKYSKKYILRLYASEAPFGGNVVGLETASWRYFGRPAWKLSWAESAMLAVLPNAPSLIFPGKNQKMLKNKRDRLLKKLYLKGEIDSLTYQLSLKEEIPGRPLALPQVAPHLLDHAEKSGKKGQKMVSSVDIYLQERVNDLLSLHFERLSSNEIYNAAALVIEIESGEVKAYNGNIPGHPVSHKGYDVDIIQAPRSTGSILKPFLYAMLMNDGFYLPESLVPDIPTIMGDYAPKNYHLTYDGAVPLKNAISRSLNVPAVRLLHEYGIEKFHHNLKNQGMTTLTHPASHYGLSIILGGAEGTIWDMAGMYRNMAWKLNHYHLRKAGIKKEAEEVIWKKDTKLSSVKMENFPSASCIYQTFEAMNEVSRPEEDQSWRMYSSSYKIAWKTGTSFGHRDGWAIGCTPNYVVAVWAGNASGEGMPGLTGIDAAAPIMFDIFRVLKKSSWFVKPVGDMQKIAICPNSGFKASEICPKADTLWIPGTGSNTELCPYHQWIFLDKNQLRVSGECESVTNMERKSWFTLPPIMEYYYKPHHPDYKQLPDWRKDCSAFGSTRRSFSIIYPKHRSKIYVPVELDEKLGEAIFEVACTKTGVSLFWYLDDQYLGKTESFHQMGLNPSPGHHKLTVVNEDGESHAILFEILGKK